MASFTPFVTLLAEIEDPRRAEGKLYLLPHVVLFAILAIVAGANSYRTIHSFIDVHLARLRDVFGLKWRKAPAYTTIRGILRQLEAVFRRDAAALNVPPRSRADIAWRSTARPYDIASTTFSIGAPRTRSAPLPPMRPRLSLASASARSPAANPSSRFGNQGVRNPGFCNGPPVVN